MFDPPPPSAADAEFRRVLFIDHTAKMGGGEVALLNLARALLGSRYRPEVILFEDGTLRERLEVAGVPTRVMALDRGIINVRKDRLGPRSLLRLGRVAAAGGFIRQLARAVRASGADVVHTNSLKADVLGGAAARLAGVPVVWHVRDRISADYLPRPVVLAFRALAAVLPNDLVANSASTLAIIQPLRLRRRATAGRVIYSGVERSDVKPADPPTDGAAAAGHGSPVVALVGRIARWKGQDVYVRAAARVLEKFPDARFQVVGAPLFGEDDYEAEVRALARTLGIGGAVEFTGFRDDAKALIGRLDVLVHASVTPEPFGQVVVEGMAAGRPVVATRGGGVAEIVVDGQTGHLVTMGDPGAMADAICDLLGDPARAAAMGEAGRRRVLEHFTIDHSVRAVRAVYDELLDPKMACRAPQAQPSSVLQHGPEVG